MKHISITVPTFIILCLCGVQLFVSHRLSTEGIALTEMTNEITALHQQNEILTHQIASASSHMTISNRAVELGFKPAVISYIEQPPMALSTR